eukprot:6179068-Pleurochrysis_carterae.AAC.1
MASHLSSFAHTQRIIDSRHEIRHRPPGAHSRRPVERDTRNSPARRAGSSIQQTTEPTGRHVL